MAIDGVHEHVALLVQESEQRLRAIENGYYEGGRILARVGAFGDLDIQAERREAGVGGMRVCDEPACWIGLLDLDCGGGRVLAQDCWPGAMRVRRCRRAARTLVAALRALAARVEGRLGG